MPEYKWNLKGYSSKYGFYTGENLSRMEAERTLQLEPEPPKVSNLNDYIIQAQQQNNLRYLSFFLHHYEKMLNGRIYNFWCSDGNERYDPERFLDYKMACVVAVIERFLDYDPSIGADFTTYLYPFITDALLSCRMLEESWSVDSLDQYKKIRGIAWKYRTSGENTKKTISEYAAEKNCKQETAAEYLKAAKGLRSRQSFYVSRQMKTARKPVKMSAETITGTTPKSSGMASKLKPFKKLLILSTIGNRLCWKNAMLSVCTAAE